MNDHKNKILPRIPVEQITEVFCIAYCNIGDKRTMLDATALLSLMEKGWKISKIKQAIGGINFTLRYQKNK